MYLGFYSYHYTTLGVGGGVVHNFAPLQVTCQESWLFHHIIGMTNTGVGHAAGHGVGGGQFSKQK